MSLLVVGSMAFDAIETPFGKVDRTLGGAASYFALAASQFTPVRVVAIVGEDFTDKEKAVFKGRKIDLSGVEHARREELLLGRPLQPEHERAHHARHRTERLRQFQADASRIPISIPRAFSLAISTPRCSAPSSSK